MEVMTVTGPVPADQLGITLIHEHLLFDGDWHYRPVEEAGRRAIAKSPLRIDTLGFARKYCYEHLDNSHRLDVDEAIREITFFKRAGGQTVVDQTPIGLGRDPRSLRAIARASGLNVVMGCGYYVHVRHPESLNERSIEDITDELVREVTVGMGTTGIRAGIIGEIGTSDLVTEREEKVLRAAARAQAITKVPLSIHHVVWGRHAPRILRFCAEEGADLRRVLICHVDLDARCPLEYFLQIAETGAYLSFDTFSHYDFYVYRNPQKGRTYATDWDRAEQIARVAEAGYLDRVVVAQDICLKIQLRSWGGFGFDHILDSVLPMFRAQGLSERQIEMLLVDNPRRVLSGEEAG
jgi:phosphotriesterase-related protein